jgi:hypothetical protein
MFQSCKYIGKLAHKLGDEYTWKYELTDSEFGTIFGAIIIERWLVEFEIIVIQEYSKRNLNVAANLVACLVWQHKKYGQPIQQIIYYNKKYNPLFLQYEEDIQKYLVLV